MKGYKVTDKNRRKLVGVACDSLFQLLIKGKEKLGIKEEEEVKAALHDGTIVDDEDYFQALPPQTIIILYQKNEEMMTGVDIILNVLRQVNTSYLETGSKAKEFILTKTNELMDILEKCEKKEKSEAHKNTREEDPKWFEGLETNARTKDEFMFRKSQDRIRGYFYKFQDDLRKNETVNKNSEFRKIAEECLKYLKNKLKDDEYFGCYFDRRYAGTINLKMKGRKKRRKICSGYEKASYCDKAGQFLCQGRWKLESCEFGWEHQINPYLSKEARIIFSTWNLDHRIERSRAVTPSLVKAIEDCGKRRSVNFLYFYQLLFTKCNLKLVHVVCHDKSVHDVSCDPKFIYT